MSAGPGICAAAPRSCVARCQHASRSCREHRQTQCLAAAVVAAVTIGTAAVAAAAFEAAAAYAFRKGSSHGAFHSSELLQWMQNLNLAPIYVEVVGLSNGLSSPRGCPWLTRTQPQIRCCVAPYDRGTATAQPVCQPHYNGRCMQNVQFTPGHIQAEVQHACMCSACGYVTSLARHCVQPPWFAAPAAHPP